MTKTKINKKRLIAVTGLAAVAVAGGLIAGIALASDKPSYQHVDNNKMFSAAAVQDAEVGKMILTAAEREMIERVVAAEARGESFEGQAVAAVFDYGILSLDGACATRTKWWRAVISSRILYTMKPKPRLRNARRS